MEKNINRIIIKAVLVERGGAERLLSVSRRDTREPTSVWQSNWVVPLRQCQSGVPMIANLEWKPISRWPDFLMLV